MWGGGHSPWGLCLKSPNSKAHNLIAHPLWLLSCQLDPAQALSTPEPWLPLQDHTEDAPGLLPGHRDLGAMRG